MPKKYKATLPEMTRSMKPARDAVMKMVTAMTSIPPSQRTLMTVFLAVIMKARAKGMDNTMANARSFGFE